MEGVPARNPERNTKAEPGFIKRRNRISGQFSAKLIEMLESPAWRALSLSGRRVVDRIEIELAHHGGNDNGRLPVTKLDFMEYGISARLVAPAIREAEALGFIRVTKRGRGGNAEYHQPNRFFLTFAHCRTSRSEPPTHDWRKIKALDEAMEIAKTARENKDSRAVRFGERRARKTKKPVSQSGPGSRPTNWSRKPQNPGPTKWSYRVGSQSGTTFYIFGRSGSTAAASLLVYPQGS
jgi:hypothetical protein